MISVKYIGSDICSHFKYRDFNVSIVLVREGYVRTFLLRLVSVRILMPVIRGFCFVLVLVPTFTFSVCWMLC